MRGIKWFAGAGTRVRRIGAGNGAALSPHAAAESIRYAGMITVIERDLEAAEKRVKVCAKYMMENTVNAVLLGHELKRIYIAKAMVEMF